MSNSTDITRLRKEGKLDEAYALALECMAAQPGDVWNRRAYAWTIYFLAKRSAETNDLPGLKARIEEYRVLNPQPRPDLVHSTMLALVLRQPEELRAQFDFIDWFRFWRIPGDFGEKDWLPAEKKKLPSLAEKACNAWCRALVQRGRHLPAEELAASLETIEAVADAHPDFIWLPYFTAKIRLATATGEPETARARLLPFVRSKHTEFWAWDLLADAFPAEETDLVEACLCKALSCHAEQQYLVKVKRRLENLRNKKDAGYLTPEEIQARAQKAEALVFGQDQAKGTGVVEGIDRNTGTVFFALKPDVRGRFSARRYPKWKFQVGDLYDFQLLKIEKHGKSFWEILTLSPATGSPGEDIYRVFSGKFRRSPSQPFGFVGDAFVPPNLVSIHGLTDGMPVDAGALWAFDPKKQRNGWKVILIVK